MQLKPHVSTEKQFCYFTEVGPIKQWRWGDYKETKA